MKGPPREEPSLSPEKGGRGGGGFELPNRVIWRPTQALLLILHPSQEFPLQFLKNSLLLTKARLPKVDSGF